MRFKPVTVGDLATAGATKISTVQAYAAAGDLVLDGTLVTSGVATLDKPRRVLITSTGTDTGKTFTIYGTNHEGNAISEALTGGSSGSPVYSTLDYATVNRVSISAAAAANVSVGTNGVASSKPIFLDHYGYSQVALQLDVTGTVNYTVQQTLDNPNLDAVSDVIWIDHGDTNLVGVASSAQGNYAFLPRCCRVTLNSGTGSVKMTVIQAGTPST
jgi:hypothetical protein